MKDLETRIRDALSEFYADPLFLEKLAAMAVQIAEDDQDYVPNYLLRQITSDGNCASLKTEMQEYFTVEKTARGALEESKSLFQALPDTAAFVLSNRGILPIEIEKSVSVFQDYFLKLRKLAKEDSDFAKAIIFYSVAMALYEWKDRQRGGAPYDPEVHGPITFASGPSKKPK